MIRFLLILLTGFVGSLFLFPINLPFAPTVNTKMLLAVLGAGVFFLEKTDRRSPTISGDFIVLCIICTCVSIWAYFSTVINHTTDYAFATYLISVIVWLGAAYAFTWMIRQTHGRLDFRLISHYLIGICIFQCILAYCMSLFPWLKEFVNDLMGNSQAYLRSVRGRLYGFGAALDPAGLRFSGVLILLGYLIHENNFQINPWHGILYLSAFFIIAVLGNMIARTTTLGMLLAFAYFLIEVLSTKKEGGYGAFWAATFPLFVILISLIIWLYHISPTFKDDLRFGFEGFFSLVEKGRWEVHSNEVLKGMVVWPEYLETWIYGDGYFDSPDDLPNRFGQTFEGFYMKTDIGYLRYIFYFGVIGLIGLISTFFQITSTCIRRIKGYGPLFIFLLLVNLIGWFKVSSDIIMVFAPFLILAYQQNNDDVEANSSIAR